MRLNGPVMACVVVAGAYAPIAMAQEDRSPAPRVGDDSPDLWTLVAPLDDPIFEVREQGEQRLIEGRTPTLAELHALLASGRLSPEQHARVRRIAFTRFATTPRGGMGVQFDIGTPGEARIQQLVDGFPAGQVIRPGDQVVAAAGVPVGNSQHLGVLILSHDAGNVMATRVVREGRTLELEVPLGNFADLNQTPNPQSLGAAYRVRAERDGAAERRSTGTLGRGLTLDAWTRAELGSDPPESLPTGARAPARQGAERASVIGGEPQPAPPEAMAAVAPGGNASAWLQRRGELARRRAMLALEIERARASGEPEGVDELGRRLEKYDAMLAEMNRRLGLSGDVITP